MKSDALAKIVMLKGSMRCFVFGLMGLVPFIGLPFAFVSLWLSGVVRQREKQYWNAAKPYRICGIIAAATGALVTVIIAALIGYSAVTSSGNND
ncbi:MAG TPA: hypothetical protein VGV18_03330 [Verrucomicrobiae bacterium]|nr:hypothetical protein [Verrucomicrobiae bacterium]